MNFKVFQDAWNVHKQTARLGADEWGEVLLLHLHKALAGGAGLQQQHRVHPLQGRQRFLSQYRPICFHSLQHSKDMFLETIPARGWQYAGKGREYASSTFSLWKKDSEIRVKGENSTRN